MILLLLICILLIFFMVWNIFPIFYQENNEYPVQNIASICDPLALPVELKNNNKKAIIFIHGFSGSPASYRETANKAFVCGYDVFIPLLPGHGTKPEDFTSTNFSMYKHYIFDYYKNIRPLYEEVHIVGSSMGGSLTLALAEEFCALPNEKPTSITTIGAPVILNSFFKYRFIESPLLYFARFIGLFIKAIKPGFPLKRGHCTDGQEVWRGYTGVYPRQGMSVWFALRKIEPILYKITCPILILHSYEDTTVNVKNAHILSTKVQSEIVSIKLLRMRNKKHSCHDLLLYTSSKYIAWNAIIAFISEHNRNII